MLDIFRRFRLWTPLFAACENKNGNDPAYSYRVEIALEDILGDAMPILPGYCVGPKVLVGRRPVDGDRVMAYSCTLYWRCRLSVAA